MTDGKAHELFIDLTAEAAPYPGIIVRDNEISSWTVQVDEHALLAFGVPPDELETMYLYPEPARYRQFDDRGLEASPSFRATVPLHEEPSDDSLRCERQATSACEGAGLVPVSLSTLADKTHCTYTCREEYLAIKPRPSTWIELPSAEPLPLDF